MEYIEEIENKIGKKAIKKFLPLQPGDVPETSASTILLNEYINYTPKISIQEGISKFIDWYISYKNNVIKENAYN